MDGDRSQSQTAVEKWFFTPLYYPRSAWSVIGWWERRRLLYNVSVGTAGLLSLGMFVLLDPSPQDSMAFVPLLGAVIYGVAANACYSLGWMADLTLRHVLGMRAPDLGPVLLRYGFVFSLGLTLLPIPIMVAGRIMMALFGGPSH